MKFPMNLEEERLFKEYTTYKGFFMKYEVVITSYSKINNKGNEDIINTPNNTYSTYNNHKEYNKYNRAPIGVYFKNKGDNLLVRAHLYEGSHTYNILKKEDYFVINICSPYIIAQSVYDDNGNYKLIKYNNHILPYLSEAYMIHIIKIVNRKIIKSKNEYGYSDIMIIEGASLLEKNIMEPPVIPYNRADGLIVEMAVLYSRLSIVDSSQKDKIKREMEHYFKIIKRVGDKNHIKLGKKFLSGL